VHVALPAIGSLNEKTVTAKPQATRIFGSLRFVTHDTVRRIARCAVERPRAEKTALNGS
jgi:hypothetical protein